MSAFQCSPEHVDAMVRAANVHGREYGSPFSYYHDGERHILATGASFQEAGRLLYAENRRSLQARYPDSPEMSDELPEDFHFGGPFAETPSPVETLKLCDCYDYQACETGDYDESEAHSFVEALRGCAIRALPGYDAAPWEWTRPSVNA